MTGDDFYREAHRKIFASMLDLYRKGTPVDLITLTEILQNKGQLDEIGGASYLTSLTDAIPSAIHVDVYARIIREKSILRRLINRSTRLPAAIRGDGHVSVHACLARLVLLVPSPPPLQDRTGLRRPRLGSVDLEHAAAQVFALRHRHEHRVIRRLVTESPGTRTRRFASVAASASMARKSASCTWCEQL